eukprot:480717-Hanusia_phi.AAC.2
MLPHHLPPLRRTISPSPAFTVPTPAWALPCSPNFTTVPPHGRGDGEDGGAVARGACGERLEHEEEDVDCPPRDSFMVKDAASCFVSLRLLASMMSCCWNDAGLQCMRQAGRFRDEKILHKLLDISQTLVLKGDNCTFRLVSTKHKKKKVVVNTNNSSALMSFMQLTEARGEKIADGEIKERAKRLAMRTWFDGKGYCTHCFPP